MITNEVKQALLQELSQQRYKQHAFDNVAGRYPDYTSKYLKNYYYRNRDEFVNNVIDVPDTQDAAKDESHTWQYILLSALVVIAVLFVIVKACI